MNNIKKSLALIAFSASAAHAQMPTGPVNSITVSPSWGAPAAATSDGAIAIGSNAIAGLTDSGGLSTLLIAPNWAYADQTAVGTSALSWGQGDSSYGFGAVAVSNPVLGTTASATAIGSGSSAWGNNSVALGYHAYAGGSSGGAPTVAPTIVNATAIGGQSSAQANNSTAIGVGATATAVNSVALGAGSVATQANTVEVGGRRITGVAAGTAATDAVNKGQLDAAIAGVSGGTTDATARTAAANAQATADRVETKADTAMTTATASGVVATRAESKADSAIVSAGAAQTTANQALTHSTETRVMLDDFAAKTDSRFQAQDNRMNAMTTEYRSGVALAIAGTHSVVSASQAGGIGVGVATFGGQTALSLGIARQIGAVNINASVSHGGSETGAGVGFGWKL